MGVRNRAGGRVLWLSITLVLLAILAGIAFLRAREVRRPRDLLQITWADGRSPLGLLVYTAQDQGFFREQGLDVAELPFPAGRDALEAVLDGRADVATVANTPLVAAATRGASFQIVATVGRSSSELQILAHRDIATPAALRGKAVGVVPETSAAYYLDAFLAWHGIRRDEVSVRPLTIDELPTALEKGTVVAVATWSQHLIRLRTKLAKETHIFPSAEIYEFLWQVVASETLARDETQIRAFVRALLAAKRYVAHNAQGRMRSIDVRIPEIPPAQLDNMRLDVSLDQSLLLSLEQEERWYRYQTHREREPPLNFLNYVLVEALAKEDPYAVGIIH